jgi:hypothetical protein
MLIQSPLAIKSRAMAAQEIAARAKQMHEGRKERLEA